MLTLKEAQTIVDAALKKGREKNMKPLTVAVLDARGCLVARQQRERFVHALRPVIGERRRLHDGSLRAGDGRSTVGDAATPECTCAAAARTAATMFS